MVPQHLMWTPENVRETKKTPKHGHFLCDAKWFCMLVNSG